MNDKTHKISRPYILYERIPNDALTILFIATYWGIVMVYIGRSYTELRFAYDGSMHKRYIKKFHATRYCVTLAERFAGEVGMG